MERKKHTTSVTKHIRSSRKDITILFTDIEDSTSYWASKGDVEGRLMVDRHNRLLFPVIRYFKGKLIKTMGDAIMASFRKPENAVLAAIAMQQRLRIERRRDKSFDIRIRIGIHTGEAIIESRDVFGDAVNVASRIENKTPTGGIYISGGTAGALPDKGNGFPLKRRSSFKPKGKKGTVTLYRCNWSKYRDLTEKIRSENFIPLPKSQKIEFYVHLAMGSIFLFLFFTKILRFLLSDNEAFFLYMINPAEAFRFYPVVPALMFFPLVEFIIFLFRIKTIPLTAFRVAKGLFGASVLFLLFFIPIKVFDISMPDLWEEDLLRSKHLFVRITADDVNIRECPSKGCRVLMQADKGEIFLFNSIRKVGGIKYNKILIGLERYGWVPRVIPPRMGAERKRLSYTDKFRLQYKDLFALAAALTGFMWGYASFHIRPE